MDTTRYYKIKEVADILNAHRNTVYNMVVTGEIEATKIRNAWRISQESLDVYIRSRSNKTHA